MTVSCLNCKYSTRKSEGMKTPCELSCLKHGLGILEPSITAKLCDHYKAVEIKNWEDVKKEAAKC